MKPYFDLPTPRVLAHRGLATTAPENTPLAFAHAIAAGARYIETDVHASSDGAAIVAHDPDLDRLAGRPGNVADLTRAELERIDLGHGQSFVGLDEVLHGFPETRFNIDIKSPAAVEPTVTAIRNAAATDRVLVTSFSEARRRAAVRALPGVATSVSAARFVPALLSGKIGFGPGLKAALAGIDAVQIPERAIGMSTLSPRLVRAFHRAGVEVHVWTINDPPRMVELVRLGVDGIVTDRADVAVRVIAQGTDIPSL